MKYLTDFKSYKDLRVFASKSWSDKELKNLWDNRFKYNFFVI
jgi:hypothetical protein